MQFKILKKSKLSKARIGLIETKHGVVETPCLVAVATQATVKTLESHEVEQAKSQMLISNTFHLHLKPGPARIGYAKGVAGGEKIIQRAGGLHQFMHWKHPLMTDSGGYQVFSLGFGRDLGLGSKITKEGRASHKEIKLNNQPKDIKITDEGVYFRSPVNGEKLFLGPKESIKIQEKLGADIIFAFDECTPPLASHEYVKKSLEKTHRWAKMCLAVKKSDQALFGIVQGSRFKDLRVESAKYIASLPFDGFGIGGEFGSDKKEMDKMLGWVIDELPEKKPRHLLGVGYLEDMERIIKQGVDTFDCTVPTHYARRGIAFTSKGKLNLNQTKFLKKLEPLDKECDCYVCNTYTKSYICHLLKAKEITALKLLTFHNLFYFNSYVEAIKVKIKKGEL